MIERNSALARKWQSLRPLFILLGVFLCCASADGQDKFGYVLDARGDWVLNSSTKLAKGSSVTVGGVITTPSPGDGGSYIVVTDRNGNIFDRRNCNNSGECNKPINLPASAAGEQSFTSRIIGAAMALVSSEPTKYASFVSRGTDLQEAVVKLEADRIDLSSVFKNMQGDRYLVRFEPVSKGNTSRGRSPKPLDFKWDPNKPEPLVAKELGPGLYKVSLLELSVLEADAGEHEPTGNEAWVLVATADQYPRAASSFDDAKKVMTKQWGTNVKASAMREFLRASLDFITAQNKQ